MSEPFNDGGPAFAEHRKVELENGKSCYRRVGGMSLRDYFAGAVLIGQSSILDERRCPSDRLKDAEAWCKDMHAGDAKYCYEMADAMLAERSKQA